jgi:hypothetical protein
LRSASRNWRSSFAFPPCVEIPLTGRLRKGWIGKGNLAINAMGLKMKLAEADAEIFGYKSALRNQMQCVGELKQYLHDSKAEINALHSKLMALREAYIEAKAEIEHLLRGYALRQDVIIAGMFKS